MSLTSTKYLCLKMSLSFSHIKIISLFYVVLSSIICFGSEGANILVIVPQPSISHQAPFRRVQLALAARGHNLTVLTTHPILNPPENYRQIDLSFTQNEMKNMKNGFDRAKIFHMHPFLLTKFFSIYSSTICNIQLNSSTVQEFVSQDSTKYDVAFVEVLTFQCYYGLLHRLGSPSLVGMSLFSALSVIKDTIDSPSNPAYLPEFFTHSKDRMTLWERMVSLATSLKFWYEWRWNVLPMAEDLQRKYFGEGLPSVEDTDRNYSLLVVNRKASDLYPVPHGPLVLQTADLHIKHTQNPLPEPIKNFLDDAEEHGVVFFSLGSQIPCSSVSSEKVQSLMEAFAEIPQRVLFKWETGEPSGKPDNVMLIKWTPQQDVLAHRNVRLFITQGGAQSLQEATYHAVPVVVIPFFVDQFQNAELIERSGGGIRLDYYNLTKPSVLWAIRKVIRSESYRKNMQKRSVIFKDEPQPSVDLVVWWIEYVIRHGGAPHLRSGTRRTIWYLNFIPLDVLLAATTGFLILFIILLNLFMRNTSFPVIGNPCKIFRQ